MFCSKGRLGYLWLNFLLFLGLSVGVATQASASCRLVIKGFNYQALECDSYVPLVNETSTLIELAKRTIKHPQCLQKLSELAAADAACVGEIYFMAVALSESYALLEGAAAAGTLVETAGEVYIIVTGLKETFAQANACQATYNKFARWSEDKNCSGVGQRPQLPAKYREAKPARVTYSSGLRYLETLDGSKKMPYEGRFYNAQTNKCDVYSQGRLLTSTLFSLCDEFKSGETFHWSIPDQACTHMSYGTDLGRVQDYRCGTRYEKNEIVYKSATGVCYRTIGKFITYLNDSSCSGLTPVEDAYLWKNNSCELYRNGRSSISVNKSLCGRAENSRYEFNVNTAEVGQCRRIKENGLSDLVANSYCQQPSRYVVKGIASCTVSVDGVYQKLLFDGQEDCLLSASNPSPIEPVPDFVCLDSASDGDGDGWGWENGASCKVLSAAPTASTSEIYVQAPTSISASGSFTVTVTSKLQQSVLAELWLKEEGGNWSPYAEAQFFMHPGQNIPSAMIHTFPDASKRYRIEVRVIENNYSKEVFAERVSIQY